MYFYAVLIIFMTAGLNYYKPKFNWDALDKHSELDNFKSECKALFDGPLDESPPNRQAGSNHACRQCPAYGKSCKLCGKKNHFPKKCRSNKSHNSKGSASDKHKSLKYHEVNLDQEFSDDGQIDEITSKVKSMYYHDVHFNSMNTRMHINVNMKSCNGRSMKTHFKVDTGADGDLLPFGEFFKHFPGANLNDLATTVTHTPNYMPITIPKLSS